MATYQEKWDSNDLINYSFADYTLYNIHAILLSLSKFIAVNNTMSIDLSLISEILFSAPEDNLIFLITPLNFFLSNRKFASISFDW